VAENGALGKLHYIVGVIKSAPFKEARPVYRSAASATAVIYS